MPFGTGQWSRILNTTQYEIAANDKIGAIVFAPNSAAISGASGGAGVGSTDPWANFSWQACHALCQSRAGGARKVRVVFSSTVDERNRRS